MAFLSSLILFQGTAAKQSKKSKHNPDTNLFVKGVVLNFLQVRFRTVLKQNNSVNPC
jgi:hypothetical protein